MARLQYEAIKDLIDANNQSEVPTLVIIAQAYKESRFDPAAKNPSSSATGLLGVTRVAITETNRVKHTNYTITQMVIAQSAIKAGTTYLQICLDRKVRLGAALDYYGTGIGYSRGILLAYNELSSGSSNRMDVLVRNIGK